MSEIFLHRTQNITKDWGWEERTPYLQMDSRYVGYIQSTRTIVRFFTLYLIHHKVSYVIWYDDILMTRKILVCMQLIMHGARAFNKLGSEVSIVIGLASELTKFKIGRGGGGRIIFVPGKKKRSGRNVRIL